MTATVTSTYCLRSVDRVEHRVRLCCLRRGHRGPCLPFGRVPRTDVTDTNPAWVPAPRGAAE